jgi:hypothetical protein
MSRYLAVLAISLFVLCTAGSIGRAGPHGCYKSQGCH